ncbi:hypothetical protein F5Y10DRAFT_292096 [Nemania abortiva]|nr:hypothetical protein F5Y10DRAFT_292096 [Nemania abortiva]
MASRDSRSLYEIVNVGRCSEAEHDPSETPNHGPPSPIQKRPMYHSLGLANAVIIIGGTVVSFTALTFLIFLWAGRGKNPEGQLSSHAWRSIMLSGRFIQLITVSTLVLRVSLSSQTAICTSCVAALILERKSIPLSQSAPLSVLRSVKSGPHVLIDHLFRKQGFSRLLYPEVILLLIVALGTIAIQFSSTILLSDLHEHSLVEFSKEVQSNLTQGYNDQSLFIAWSMPLGDIPLFGEISSGYAATPNSQGLSDTGVKRHVMLPFTKERTTIRNYEGPAMAMSSRAMCIPPETSGEIGATVLPDGHGPYGYMTGRITVESTLERAGLGSQQICNFTQCLSEIPFRCSVPSLFGGEIATAYCTPITNSQPVTSDWRLDMSPLTPAVTIIIALATNFNAEDWALLDDEWVSYDFGNGRVINITLCFFAANVMVPNVSMGTSKELEEPSIGYRGDLSDTADIRKFLGADPTVQGLTERGALVVKNITDRSDHVFGASKVKDIDLFLRRVYANVSYPGCDICEGDFESSARDYTRMASVAIQTIHTILAQSFHDQALKFNTISSPAQVVQSVTTTIPILLVDIACILAITALYLSHSRYSMVGNFWHAISQTTSDSEISHLVEENALPVRLMRSPDTGYIKIAKADPIPHPPPDSEKHTSAMQLMWARMKRWRRKDI